MYRINVTYTFPSVSFSFYEDFAKNVWRVNDGVYLFTCLSVNLAVYIVTHLFISLSAFFFYLLMPTFLQSSLLYVFFLFITHPNLYFHASVWKWPTHVSTSAITIRQANLKIFLKRSLAYHLQDISLE